MKDSGVEWIGEIPEDWEVRKLSSIAETITDFVASGSFASLNENVKYLDVPDYAMLVRTVDLSRSSNTKRVYIDKHAYDFLSNSNLFGGELILSNIGSVGNVFMYEPLYKRASIAPNAIMIRMQESNRYYYYWFLNPLVNDALKQIGNNAVQAKFNKTQLRQFLVARPSYIEQQKIANFLDHKVAEIDHIIDKTKLSIEEYKNYKQSLITETVTKGLNPDVKMKDSGIEWIGDIPEHWDVSHLNQIFVNHKNKNADMKNKNLLSLSYGRVIRREITSNEGLLPANFSGYNIIQANDIVLRLTDLQNDKTSLRVGLCGETGIMTSAYITLRSKEEIKTDYFYFYLHSFDIYKGFYGMGSGVRQGLTYNGLKYLKLIVPPEEEQLEIIDYLGQNIKCIDTLISQKQKLLTELESYKKSLIFECVTGKREVK